MTPRSLLLGTGGFALFLGFWHVGTSGNAIGDLPGPWMTAKGLGEIAVQGVLWENIVASVFPRGVGFCLAAAVGIPLGFGLGLVSSVARVVQSFGSSVASHFAHRLVAFRGDPVWWLSHVQRPVGDLSAVHVGLFPDRDGLHIGGRFLDPRYIRSASNFGVSGLEFFRRVMLPATLPQILTGLRLALGIAWVVVVAAEMLGVESGLGYQVMDSRNALRMDYVAAAMVVIAVIGLLLDMGMARIEAAALARRGMSRR